LQIPYFIKKIAKKLQATLPFAIGKNEIYDRYTKEIIVTYCKPDAVCIDIGANEGKILDWIIQIAPQTTHYAFEPIPSLYQKLKLKYADRAKIFPIALSNQKGSSNFNLVTTNSALSGFKKRPYPSYHREKAIEVATDLLDQIIHENVKVALIKIDVEGGEWNVLKGASKTIQQNKPIILFECGKIGGALYEYTASDMYHLFSLSFEYHIYTLKGWLKTKTELSFIEFEMFYENGKEYFFLAAPKSMHKNS
jgi:FkbM family methyltransferase